jgi:hypothetical protein
VVEIIFLMLVLKLPILYLIGVIWWAVRAVPPPAEPAPLLVPAVSGPPGSDHRRRSTGPRRPRRGGPHDRGRASRRAVRKAHR